MKYALVIFDLDGTVLDTLEDLANAVNLALKKHGYPCHSIEKVRTMIGNGVANLIQRALPAGTDSATQAAVLADFKARYRDHMNDCTRPFDGICDLMKALRDAGVKVGINSNKFDAALQNLCHLHFEGLYDYAVGESELTPRKPDPTAARRIMEAVGANESNTIYIGDSSVDLNTARNAGVDGAWVSWGFRKRSEMEGCDIPVAFDTVEALKAYLLD